MSTAAIIGGTALGGIAGAVGSNMAAGKQADAANNAANLQSQASQNALNFEKQQYANSLQMLNPYLQTGYGALGLLRTGLGIPGAMPQGFSLPSSPSGVPTFNGGSLNNLNSFMRGGTPNTIGANRPIQAVADGAMVPANGGNGSPFSGGTLQLGPGQSLGNDSAGGGMSLVNGTPGVGGPTSASSGSLEVPATAGGVSPSGNSNIGFGSLLQSYPGGPFTAPTGVTEQNDPGYQFRLKTGLDQLNNSAAARGGLLSGGTLKAAQDFAQNDASNEYQNVYNRALNTYGTNYNQFVNDQTNQFNKLAAISGLGQTSANDLSTAGLQTSNQVGNNLLGTAGAIGNDLQNAGSARASGITGVTNAITGGINNLSLLAMLLNGQGGGNGVPAGGNGVF